MRGSSGNLRGRTLDLTQIGSIRENLLEEAIKKKKKKGRNFKYGFMLGSGHYFLLSCMVLGKLLNLYKLE